MDTIIPQKIIHQIIKESQNPVVFKNILKNENGKSLWQLLNWNLDELADKIGNMKLPFRQGVNQITKEPQWEYKCDIIYLTMSEFLELSKDTENSKWHYFDYKYVHEWFKNNTDIINSINWKSFGYDINSEASTIWIGNKGAHTNCHKDTYGNNLVVQIHGRKQWILFPPDVENFCETRNPYEESTIYTKLNLFKPCEKDLKYLKSLKNRPRIVTLEPGDVLFVPHGWWHFVESLDISVSVNTWLPLNTDCFDRLSEALVKMVINQIGNGTPVTNDYDKCDLLQCLNFVRQSLTECQLNEKIEPGLDSSTANNEASEIIFKNYPNNIKIIEELSCQDFESFLDNRNLRFNDKTNLVKGEPCSQLETDNLATEIIDAFCNSKIMQQVAQILLSNSSKK